MYMHNFILANNTIMKLTGNIIEDGDHRQYFEGNMISPIDIGNNLQVRQCYLSFATYFNHKLLTVLF